MTYLGSPPEGYRDYGDPWPPPRKRRSLWQWLRDVVTDWTPGRRP